MGTRSLPRMVRITGLAFVSVCLFTGFAGAQEFRSNLTGQVTDPSGGAVPNATVTAVMASTGQTYAAKTSSEGVYYVPYVLPGTYVITVKAQGFRTVVQQDVLVLAAQSYAVNFRLVVGSVTQTVTVTSTPPIINTASGSGGDVLQARAISSLPLQGRVVYNLITNTPGNSYTSGNPNGGNSTNNFEGNQAYQLGGAENINGTFNKFTLNGVNITSMDSNAGTLNGGEGAQGAWMVAPDVDAVQELNIMTQTYDARYGGTGGGVVNVVTKSGTNTFHGDAYEYLENGATDANTFTNNLTGIPVTNTKWNQYGFTLGGPIKKDRVWFFGAFEGYKESVPGAAIDSVPTAAMRNGNFSGTVDTIYNPATTVCTVPGGTLGDCPGDAYASTAFPNDTIPQADITTAGAKLVNLFPLPNTGTSYLDNYIVSNPSTTATNQPEARLDYNLTNNTRLYSFFLWQGGSSSGGNGLPGAAVQGSYGTVHDIVATQDVTHIFSPTLVGDFKAGFSRMGQFIKNGNFAAQEVIGLSGVGLSYPVPSNAFYPNLLPEISYSEDYPTVVGNIWYGGVNTNVTFSADFTKSMGRNTIEWGGEYGDYITAGTPSVNQNGQFNFGTSATQYNPTERNELPGIIDGNVIADELLGDPSTGSIVWPTNLYYTSPMWDLYVQDNIRVTHRLTLNVGLRYDVQRGIRARNNNMNSGFCETCVNPLTNNATYQAALAADAPALTAYGFSSANIANLQNLYGGITFPTGSGSSADIFGTNWNDFGPRLGFAYMITPKTVVRGGFGLFYPSLLYNNQNELGFSQTTDYTASLNGVTSDDYFSSGSPFPTGIAVPAGSSQGLETDLGNHPEMAFFNQKIPRMQIVSLGVQRELPGHILLDVSYDGNYATNLGGGFYPDAQSFPLSGGPMPGSICGLTGNVGFPQLQQSTYNACVASWYVGDVPNPFYGVAPATSSLGAVKEVSAASLLRLYPEFDEVSNEDSPYGKSWYDSLQVVFRKRLYGATRGLTFEAGYVYSRDIQSDAYLDSRPWTDILKYEDAQFDRTNVVTANGEWDLPFGQGAKYILPNPSKALGEVVNGWRLGFMFSGGSGYPEAIDQGAWNTSGYSYMPPGGPTYGEWLNNCNDKPTNCFLAKPTEGQGGTGPSQNDRVHYLRQPSVPDLDLSLMKNFPITESKHLQFRVDAFNVTNSPLFPAPDTNPNDGPPHRSAIGEWTGFGTVSFGQQNSPRIFQFALKFFF